MVDGFGLGRERLTSTRTHRHPLSEEGWEGERHYTAHRTRRGIALQPCTHHHSQGEEGGEGANRLRQTA